MFVQNNRIMKALKLTLLVLSALVCLPACSRRCEVVWTEGETLPDSKKAIHTMEITGLPKGTDWTLWFCQFRTPIEMEEGSPASIVHLGGTLYRVVPEREADAGTMTLRYEARSLVNHCRAPEGFFLQKKGGKPVPVKVSYLWQPSERVPLFEWSRVDTTPYDMVPRLKSVTSIPGETDLAAAAVREEEPVAGKAPGWYRITVNGDVSIAFGDEDGEYYAGVTLDNLRRNARGAAVPNGIVEDWPDLGYRGIMLDVSRNFTRKDDVLKLIDILAHYKLNRLHLHFGDDEGWRIEIDGLPELTSYGAFRGIPVLNEDGSISEPDALFPAYCGTLDRNDRLSPGNGYYSKADFVDMLRYAWERRIRIIPEFDTPGHSRAAIKAMEYRFAKTGDDAFRLVEPEDTSVYNSVQDYNDNALNVALPATYAFIDKVFDGLIALYAEAGAPLEAIHIGGDEVPEGAWLGSPACKALMEKEGISDVAGLKEYFICNVLAIAEAKGVKIAGWQEVAQNLSPAAFERLKGSLSFINFWAVSRGREELAYQFADDGIDVVLSNAPNNYFDFAYSYDKEERGHSWGGYVDERRSFSFLPYNMYQSVRWDDKGRLNTKFAQASEGKPALTEEGRSHIKGVSGHLWAETIRSFDHVTYYLFPKALGMAERGWNASPVWEDTTVPDDPVFVADFNKFFSIITANEYPYYDSIGISYRKCSDY